MSLEIYIIGVAGGPEATDGTTGVYAAVRSDVEFDGLIDRAVRCQVRRTKRKYLW